MKGHDHERTYSPFFLILAVLLWAAPVQAQAVCGEYEYIKSTLNSRFQETVREMAVTDGGRLVERFEAPSGTWTLILRLPSGMACVMASGEDWERLPYIPDGQREKI